IIVAALYASCVIAPTAAMAFDNGDHAAHCFSDEQLGLARAHRTAAGHAHAEGHDKADVHADGATHQHDGTHPPKSGNGNDPAACCGLFGLTAMAVDPQLDLGVPSRHSSILPVSLDKLTGRGPDRINRPPIALLSL